jgi:hypothetical protein
MQLMLCSRSMKRTVKSKQENVSCVFYSFLLQYRSYATTPPSSTSRKEEEEEEIEAAGDASKASYRHQMI